MYKKIKEIPMLVVEDPSRCSFLCKPQAIERLFCIIKEIKKDVEIYDFKGFLETYKKLMEIEINDQDSSDLFLAYFLLNMFRLILFLLLNNASKEVLQNVLKDIEISCNKINEIVDKDKITKKLVKEVKIKMPKFYDNQNVPTKDSIDVLTIGFGSFFAGVWFRFARNFYPIRHTQL